MATFYIQKNTAIDCSLAAFCSGLNAATTEQETEIEEGAIPGVTEQTIAVGIADAKQRAYYMQPTPAPGTDFIWNSGDWVVRINVTTSNMDTDWEDTFICRVNAGCTSQAEIGKLEDQGIDLSSTGVHSMTISGAAQTPSAGDSFVVVLGFSTSAHAGSGCGITPDRTIETPLTEIAGVVPIGQVVHALKPVELYPSRLVRYFRRRFNPQLLRSRYA